MTPPKAALSLNIKDSSFKEVRHGRSRAETIREEDQECHVGRSREKPADSLPELDIVQANPLGPNEETSTDRVCNPDKKAMNRVSEAKSLAVGSRYKP